MTIRILNPTDWQRILPGDMLRLNGDHQRILKIEVNCEAPTRIDLVHHDGDGEERTTMMGIVQGLDKIEVVADADAALVFSTDGEVWFCTNDGVATVAEVPEEATFTQLVGRKTRSEQLEQIIQMQQLGINRLLAAQESERIARELAEEQLAAAVEREAAKPAPAAVAPGDGAQPAPTPAPAAVAEGAAPAPASAVPAVPA